MNRPIEATSTSPEATRRLARALGLALDPVPRQGFVVALHGDLGAGKTVFVEGLAEGLHVPADAGVSSPTFTVARTYLGRCPLHHVDAYLVRGLAELEAAGFEEMGGIGRVTVVEWAERIEDALPPDRMEVTLTPIPAPIVAIPAGSTDPERGAPEAAVPARRVVARALGPVSARVLAALAPRWAAEPVA